MTSRGDVLRQVMLETGVTQTELSRISGVRQPSISQTLSGRIEISDDQLDRLLSCLGFQVEVVRRPIRPELTQSERRSWQLHRCLARQLDEPTLEDWRPTIRANLGRMRRTVQGEPHVRNVRRWRSLIESRDVGGLHRVLTGLDRHSIEMREVSPMGGLLSERDRADALALRT